MANPKALEKRRASSGSSALDGWLDLLWQLLKSEVYTPTLTDVTNLDGSTAFQCMYIRLGNMVVVSGKFQADPTASAATELGISLPIPSNFTDDQELAGVAFCSAVQQGARLLADASNNRIAVQWLANDTANRGWSFICMYQIIQ